MIQECGQEGSRECEPVDGGTCPTCGTHLRGASTSRGGERHVTATTSTGDRLGWTLEDYARWAKSAFLPPADPA